MYQLDVVTIFPEMFSSVLEHGVIGRAVSDELLGFRSWNPRDYTEDKHRTVDDRPYGGGPGMVMMYEPLCSAIAKAKQAQPGTKVIYLSPQGRRLDQEQPKYLHLKRPVPLYNRDALAELDKGKKIYIAEGVFDAMMLEQNGYKAVGIL